MMKKSLFVVLFGWVWMMATGPALAHFGMVIPSDSMVMQGESKTIVLMLSFSHPFENIGMELSKPKTFGVRIGDQNIDLTTTLMETRVMANPAWEAGYTIKRPGVYAFHMEPAPYWEPAEDRFIIHITKTVVAAFGDDEGWDREIGLRTEIVPLAKPFGLYTGNVFQGVVKRDGKPVPHARVEVEYYNSSGKAKAPTDYMVAQTVKADADGVFTYAAPRAGWWGFAALTSADYTLKKDGEAKEVELGAVLWVEFHDWVE